MAARSGLNQPRAREANLLLPCPRLIENDGGNTMGKNKSVLIVDDEKNIRFTLKQALKSLELDCGPFYPRVARMSTRTFEIRS